MDEISLAPKPAVAPVVTPPVVAQEPIPEEIVEPVEEEVDYKAEAETLRKKLDQAEFTLRKRNVERKQERILDPIPESPEVDAMIEEKVREGLTNIRHSEANELIEEMIVTSAENDDEADLIRLHYENSIVKTGFTKSAIREDVQKAKLLANAARYLREKKEIAQTLKAKSSLGRGTAAGTNQDRPTPTEDLSKKFTAKDWAYMQKRNFTPEMIRKAIP